MQHAHPMHRSQDELSSASSSASSRSSGLPASLQSSDLPAVEHETSGDLLDKFRKYVLNHVLETKHGREPNLDVFNLLSQPSNVSKIIKFLPCSQQQLLRQFITLEKFKPGFVWKLMSKYHEAAACIKDLPDSHEYGFTNNLQLGKFLVKAGWYAEAQLILKVALKQADRRGIRLLKVLTALLLAQSFSSLHDEAFRTIQQVLQLTKIKNLSDDLRIAAHSALSTGYFEMSCFGASYEEAMTALELVNVQNSSCEVIVDTLRLMGRCCVAIGQSLQAKLLLTQAISWSRKMLGDKSLSYAETLEDYAFYLLMMNSLDSCQVACAQAKYIYQVLYGPLSLRPELAQGNLAFRSYLECYEYRNVLPVDEFFKLAFNLGHDTEDRQILAIKRIPTYIAAAKRCNEEEPSGDERRDVFEGIHTMISLDDIRWLFYGFFIDRYSK